MPRFAGSCGLLMVKVPEHCDLFCDHEHQLRLTIFGDVRPVILLAEGIPMGKIHRRVGHCQRVAALASESSVTSDEVKKDTFAIHR